MSSGDLIMFDMLTFVDRSIVHLRHIYLHYPRSLGLQSCRWHLVCRDVRNEMVGVEGGCEVVLLDRVDQ